MLLNVALAAAATFDLPHVFAQSNSSVVCVAGQCLQGFSNVTIGVTLSSPGVGSDVLLLPGQYSSSTNPQLLHDLLTSSSTQSSPSPGFNVTTGSLPLDVVLQPGLAIFPQTLYSGQASFAALPSARSNSSTKFSASSLSISSNVWVAVTSGSSQSRTILWDSIPDITQASSLSNLSLVDMQSSACSIPCSSAGICSSSGQCSCPAGFTGASCESCAPGFFGPNCQACPANCTSCDEGISGSGRCLVPIISNPPSSCNCLNGQCGVDGQCACNAGWTAASNGTACAACAPGFFSDSNGDCSKCQLGCDQCSDGSGICVACSTGFTQDANDRTKCNPVTSTTSTGTQCPDGSFSNGTQCVQCSTSCQTCNGPTSNDCIICANAQFKLNGTCVPTDANGICSESTMIANNNKHECDSCPAKCTSCAIPGFNVASTTNQAQCTGCLPGFVLSGGQCVENCPSGMFLDPKDNLTCTACDSSCGTCVGSSTFCLTCANSKLASNGQCVTSCPSNTFSSSGACVSCHPDCAVCSGASFNQCTACPADRPVLSNGRCLPTCSRTQFFDTASGTCQTCDSSCSSCSGAGPSQCLACASSSQVLRSGSCTAAQCTNGSSVIPGLGVCLSDLVAVPQASGTASPTPLPSITGITAPTTAGSGSSHLAWWQILLMALGCAFIFIAVLWLYRRRQRKKRAARTAAFAASKNLTGRGNWRWRIARFGERLFGGHPPTEEQRGLKTLQLQHAEEERHAREMNKLGGPSALPSYYNSRAPSPAQGAESLYSESLYSQVTGMPRRVPVPRQPVKAPAPMASRFSWTTHASSSSTSSSRRAQTEAQRYASTVRTGTPTPSEPDRENERDRFLLKPSHTGASTNNPFRR